MSSETEAALPFEPRVLCRADEIGEAGGKGFVLGEGRQKREIFVVRKEGRVYGYLNSCPHAGTPLDWMPDRFFTNDGRFLICATHGALFEVEDGMCLRGPCRGLALDPVDVAEEGGEILLMEPDVRPPPPAPPASPPASPTS
ncbi:nitrite reductase/ring-hydroxylating ferredoxin subunit [Stella humosa]|uniref:Nitrite reductase/ring-hydroxylating ferredoxin subunit n=1 Tax=Stella humosa TaxID=94 RepID=A0A3N1LIU3_9PROT|nr:Rieske (2Fe-2S) protein [Stella humosa]ROP91210.1 nitrite reductase/ring-hydroxylating ferredoxin subunit [Stella humosa]BBK34437.1 hypothetical protein STHU_50710 [Stella humosa]